MGPNRAALECWNKILFPQGRTVKPDTGMDGSSLARP